jgi:hypothetical protein
MSLLSSDAFDPKQRAPTAKALGALSFAPGIGADPAQKGGTDEVHIPNAIWRQS